MYVHLSYFTGTFRYCLRYDNIQSFSQCSLSAGVKSMHQLGRNASPVRRDSANRTRLMADKHLGTLWYIHVPILDCFFCVLATPLCEQLGKEPPGHEHSQATISLQSCRDKVAFVLTMATPGSGTTP